MFVAIRNFFYDVHRTYDLQNTCWPVLWSPDRRGSGQIYLSRILLDSTFNLFVKVSRRKHTITAQLIAIHVSDGDLLYSNGCGSSFYIFDLNVIYKYFLLNCVVVWWKNKHLINFVEEYLEY